MQFGQRAGRFAVCFDLSAGDERYMGWVHDRDRVNMRHQHIVEGIRVGGHLQHHRIAGPQHLAHPVFQIVVGHALRAIDGLMLSIHAQCHKVFLVDV